MRNYYFSGIPYVGSGQLSFSIPKSNLLYSESYFLDSEFVEFSSQEGSLLIKIKVKSPSLRSALFLLSHTLSLNCLDLLLEVSYVCITGEGKKSCRLLRSV